jgi:hypothetical protein
MLLQNNENRCHDWALSSSKNKCTREGSVIPIYLELTTKRAEQYGQQKVENVFSYN